MEPTTKRSKESKKGRSVPDMNNMEFANAQLKGKLKILTSEMKDAVDRINLMTSEIDMLRNENVLCRDRITSLEQENALLVSQLEEMVEERTERDAIIEEFGTAVEARIVQWKAILDEKDTMITKLKENLLSAASDRMATASPDEKSNVEIERLIKDIDRRDEVIAELQSKLSEAVVEINESSLLIEKFRSDNKSKDRSRRNSKDQREIDKKIQNATRRIGTLESLLERAEKDAKVKSEQLCEALAMLNKYEDEESSLSQALKDIKDLQDQMAKKNKHIEDLLSVVNRLEMENSRFEEAIVVLRDRLSNDENEDIDLEGMVLSRQQEQEEKLEDLHRNIDRMTNENVDLKFQVRKLKNALKESIKNKLNKVNGTASDGEHIEDLSYKSESKKDHMELRRMRENVKWVIEENEALRQGMHEILDCIHHHDGKSMIAIQSRTLENLLDALDARHLAGWYHPAMRLQGRVNYLQGSNAELRTQLQQIRKSQLQLQQQNRAGSSAEEGECSVGMGDSPRGQDELASNGNKTDQAMTLSPSATSAKSIRSSRSQAADSGMASAKAAEIDTPDDVDRSTRSPADHDEDEDNNRHCHLVDGESVVDVTERVYAMAKELVTRDSEFRSALNDAESRRKLLESQLLAARKQLASRVPGEVHADLRQKYLESSMRLRAALENNLLHQHQEQSDNSADTSSPSSARMIQELRDELTNLHSRLSNLLTGVSHIGASSDILENGTLKEDLEQKLSELQAENKKLARELELAKQETETHRAIDAAIVDELRGKLQVGQREVEERPEDGGDEVVCDKKVDLEAELVQRKLVEVELKQRQRHTESELKKVRKELAELADGVGGRLENFTESNAIRDYIEIIDFLQYQYAGSTSLSAWERYEANLNRLNNDRNEVKELVTKVNDQNESLKMQHETLANRLQIVEQLKDMLEQQIGSNDVQEVMKKFTSETRQALSESNLKMQVSRLEDELQKAHDSLAEYETKISSMELEMSQVQRAWKVQKVSNYRRPSSLDKVTETDAVIDRSDSIKYFNEKSMQTDPIGQLTEIKSDSVCKIIVSTPSDEEDDDNSGLHQHASDDLISEKKQPGFLQSASVSLLQEQLSQALNLASERSLALSKCESQLAEYRAKLVALSKLLDARDPHLDHRHTSEFDNIGLALSSTSSEEALHSSIKSLERIIAQKEDTIGRYQALLKEDRDKHSEAAARLHQEIQMLKDQIAKLKTNPPINPDISQKTTVERPERDLNIPISSEGTSTKVRNELQSSNTISRVPPPSLPSEEASILRDKIFRLETELNVSSELAERWHRLAEDRLRHMDGMRERLEKQHREEIDSYRLELSTRQREIDELRRQISENRRVPSTKSEVLNFMKALQIQDNRLADEIENELEEHATIASQNSQRTHSATYVVEESERFENEQREHELQTQVENLRRQLQASMERERSSKREISDLQQQLSRKYMAMKAQERKVSRREMQLERKVRELDEELHDAKEMLDREFRVQQAKRAKTAEDLGLWEKSKRWQQTAERLKEKLREKSEECQRLQNNYEKLRNLIACMEREKWFLRGKLHSQQNQHQNPTSARSGTSSGRIGGMLQLPMDAWSTIQEQEQRQEPEREKSCSSVGIDNNNEQLIEDLRAECIELRQRVKELVARLAERRERDQDLGVERIKRPAALAFNDDDYGNDEARRLQNVIEILEKENLRLEAENFELRLELERANVNVPRYQDKIQHLEKYIELLKSEKSLEGIHTQPSSNTPPPRRESSLQQHSKLELERTVVTLKKVIEKLQAENKRLRVRDGSGCNCNCAKELEIANKRVSCLQNELELLAEKRLQADGTVEDMREELEEFRRQLIAKNELLAKVKQLLTKAAANEKALRQRIQQLEYKQTLAVIPECGSSLAMADG
ncbi:hypothetical protein QAD02_004595 [Eretmocerus hayati]|uniref:Uncharacterized protein n=1 Tax=Eretmocerus hayati TaxID=131215 RepID=A0ACC2NR73_9HYME|nr:hypothetical protein QAD02_004595 [Eretmocerus hayati]